MKYMTNRKKAAAILLLAVILAAAVFHFQSGWIRARAEDQLITCWVMCKPGDYINVRRTPSTHAEAVGYLEAGDSFLTDGSSKNGFIRVFNIGEYGEGWIFAGYVSTEEPVPVFQRYVCVSNSRVRCRRWMNGKLTQNPWITNGSNVDVFYMADGWAMTSRGFIQSKYLEADPE